MPHGKVRPMSTPDTAPPGVTNRAVAITLQLSESGVSRLRSGDRLPSLGLMQKIEAAYGWTVQDQSNARAAGRWTDTFNSRLLVP
jgi:hypothetical protein